MQRKDNKGRNLKTGESQRQDGRYMYRYIDEVSGKRVVVYGLTLQELREQEKQIAKNMSKHITTDTFVKKITINDMFKKYMSTKNIRDTTRYNYLRLWKNLVQNTIGNSSLVCFRHSDSLAFFAQTANKGYSKATIRTVCSLLEPTFEMAVNDRIIESNPITGTAKGFGSNKRTTVSLTSDQEIRLFRFVKNDNVYSKRLPMLKIMLGTCLRISELAGLTWDDVDMDKKIIKITDQVIYGYRSKEKEFFVSPTKTLSGIRTIPMTKEVYKAFEEQKEINELLNIKSKNIDNKSNFIFVTRKGYPVNSSEFFTLINRIIRKFNKNEIIQAEEQHREPELLPRISAHVFRHTGCTRMNENNVNPKVMQYVMGHSKLTTTMDTYTHVTDIETIKKEFLKVDKAEMV
jgi:integrase